METVDIFPWNDNFETHIDSIDEQHKVLVQILNKLASHLANRSSPGALNSVFDELVNYADYHFKAEEEIWRTHFKDDPVYTTHMETHESFVAEVVALKSEESHKPLDDIVQEVVSFLARWLAYHILDSDKRMAKTVLLLQAGNSMSDAKAIANEEMSGSMKLLIDTVLTMYDTISSRTMDLMREKALREQAEKALLESEERWKFLLEGGAEGIWDWNIARDEIDFSENSTSLFEIISKQSSKLGQGSTVHPDDIERAQNDLQAHLSGATEFYINKHRVKHEGGNWSWILTRGKVVDRDDGGNAVRMVGTHSDITERELAAVIYRHTAQGMYVTDADNSIISVNPAFSKITGYAEQESIGKNPSFTSSGMQNKQFYEGMWKSIKSQGSWSGELWNKRKNGDVYPEYLDINTVTNEDGNVDYHFVLFSDITERKKAEALIFEQANIDPLTSLPNRRMFQDRLQQEIKRSHRSQLSFALLFIDLDNFKEVNDSVGHELGDQLLIEAAQRILNFVRETDTVSRLGGDEFTIIIPDLREEINIDRVTGDIIGALSEAFQLGDHEVYVSASVGITVYPKDAESSSELLKNADQAMYLAKRSGRSCFSYFTPSIQEAAEKRQWLINDLRNALELEQFQLYYQPIVDLSTGKIEKAEALLRWFHPEHGTVTPNSFIPLAEQSGLITDLGDWVFREATRQAALWSGAFDIDFQISINKSPFQFRSTEKFEHWLQHLKQLGLSGKNCTIEITENLMMENDKTILNQLLQYRDAGIEIALDDFGTGYSSLSYLQNFDIDYIKIDRSFIKQLTPESHDITLCEAMIVMAHKLNIKVVAEGVETFLQNRLLIETGCDYGQGFFFSKPVPASEFEQILGI